MRTAFLIGLVLLVGCSQEPSAWQQAMRMTSEEVVTKQDESITILKANTTALTAIKSQVDGLVESTTETREKLEALVVKSEAPKAEEEVIKSALEPQETAQANPSQSHQPVALSPAVRLFVTHAPFACPPCERLKRAVESGEFDGFAVEDSGDFPGLRSYPAIRFETPKTSTGWGVVYGYDSSTIPTLRAMTGPTKEQPVVLIDRGTRSPVVRIKSTRRGFFGLFR